MYVHPACYICVSMRLEKEARQVKKNFFGFKNELLTCIKSTGDKIGIPDGCVI